MTFSDLTTAVLAGILSGTAQSSANRSAVRSAIGLCESVMEVERVAIQMRDKLNAARGDDEGKPLEVPGDASDLPGSARGLYAALGALYAETPAYDNGRAIDRDISQMRSSLDTLIQRLEA